MSGRDLDTKSGECARFQLATNQIGEVIEVARLGGYVIVSIPAYEASPTEHRPSRDVWLTPGQAKAFASGIGALLEVDDD